MRSLNQIGLVKLALVLIALSVVQFAAGQTNNSPAKPKAVYRVPYTTQQTKATSKGKDSIVITDGTNSRIVYLPSTKAEDSLFEGKRISLPHAKSRGIYSEHRNELSAGQKVAILLYPQTASPVLFITNQVSVEEKNPDWLEHKDLQIPVLITKDSIVIGYSTKGNTNKKILYIGDMNVDKTNQFSGWPEMVFRAIDNENKTCEVTVLVTNYDFELTISYTKANEGTISYIYTEQNFKDRMNDN